MNIAPFYVGQEVVAVDAVPSSAFKNGQDYIISAVEYKFGNRNHPIGRITKYWYVGIVGFSNIACYRPAIFAPKIKIPFMTFTEIVETEILEVLVNN